MKARLSVVDIDGEQNPFALAHHSRQSADGHAEHFEPGRAEVVPLVDGREAAALLLSLRSMLQWAVRLAEPAAADNEPMHIALQRDLTAARAAIAKAMP